MKIFRCFGLNFVTLLSLGHIAVALFGCCYYFISHNPRQITFTAKHEKFAFFYFVQTWPGSFQEERNKVLRNFTIHGLWAEDKNGFGVLCPCPDQDFNMSEIQDLRKRLDQEWPAINANYTNEKFWKKEWKKHGGCSEKYLNLTGYFNASLALKNRINIIEILSKGNITPNGTYNLEDIEQALCDELKFTPIIACNKSTSDKESQLYEIYVCLNGTEVEEIINCPPIAVERYYKRCGGKKARIKFPALDDKEESPFEMSNIYN